MTVPETVLKNENTYFGKVTLAGIPCTIGYTKKFKWSWMATQLNTFIFIGEVNTLVTKEVIEEFSNQCFNYAIKNNKGWPRGLQSGVGSVALIAGNNFSSEAMDWCEKVAKKHWSAFEIAALYYTEEKRTIRFSKQPLWGRLYFPYFAEVIDRITNGLSR